MAESNVALYEGLFLLSQNASGDLNAALEHVREILTRAEAEVVVLRKWDERKLAYAIRGQKRGLYLLAYFRARTTQIANIDRDCNLSENILRALMLKADHIGDIELEQAKSEQKTTDAEAKLRSGEGREPREAKAGSDESEQRDSGGESQSPPRPRSEAQESVAASADEE